MAYLHGSTVSQTQAASPQTAQRLRWRIDLAICTYQRTSATHGHAATKTCQPLAAFSSVDQNRILQGARYRNKSAFQLLGKFNYCPKTPWCLPTAFHKLGLSGYRTCGFGQNPLVRFTAFPGT